MTAKTMVRNIFHGFTLGIFNQTAGAPDKRADEAVLRVVAESGYKNNIKAMLKRGVDINTRDADDNTPLILALAHGRRLDHGHKNAAKFLIESDADVNAFNKKGETALLHAVIKGNIKLVRALLAKGARIDVVSKKGASPLGLAKRKGYKDIEKLLTEALAKQQKDRKPAGALTTR